MAKLPAKSTRVYVDEFALAGYLSAVNWKLDQETIKVDSLASVGPERVVGNYDGHMISLNGFFDGVDDAFDEIAFVDLNTDEDHHAFVAWGGISEGAIGYEGPIRLKSQPRSAAVGQAVLLNLETEGAGPVVRASILRTATVTGTGNGTGQNLGATVSGQLTVVTYRILAITGGAITLQTHESSDNGSGDAYANIAALASGSLSAVGVTRKTTSAATEAWKRITISAMTASSATILVTAGVAAGT